MDPGKAPPPLTSGGTASNTDWREPSTWLLAHGPGRGKVNTWDITHAVRLWAGGGLPNHGFMLHGDSHDDMIAQTREAKAVQDRPAALVIHEPPASPRRPPG